MSVLCWKSKPNLEQLHPCVEVRLPLHTLRLAHAAVEVLALHLKGRETEHLQKPPKPLKSFA